MLPQSHNARFFRRFVYFPVWSFGTNVHSTIRESQYLRFLSLGGKEDFTMSSPRSSIVLSNSFDHLGKVTVTEHLQISSIDTFVPNTKLVKALNRIANNKKRIEIVQSDRRWNKNRHKSAVKACKVVFELILLLGKSSLWNHRQILRLLHRFKVQTCGYIAQCSDSMIAACRTGYESQLELERLTFPY